MIGKDTKIFALLGPDLGANRLYHLYNYLFEANGVDAAFINISVPLAKMLFTLEGLGSSQIRSLLLTNEAAKSDEVKGFFGSLDMVVRIDVVAGGLSFVASKTEIPQDEDSLLEGARLNFFEWFGRYPLIPEDALKTLKESAPRESILTRS